MRAAIVFAWISVVAFVIGAFGSVLCVIEGKPAYLALAILDGIMVVAVAGFALKISK